MGRQYRTGRLSEEIKKIVSELILHHIKDPRIREAMVSISDVEVSRDGSYATLYVTILPASLAGNRPQAEEEAMKEEVLEGLRSAKGLLKKEIGRQVRLRHVPELIFKLDTSMEYGSHIDQVLKELDIQPAEEEEPDEE